MKIAVSSDHRGYNAKERIKVQLATAGHAIDDFGCKSQENCDYPDMAVPAARSVAQGENDRAIMICGTGLGMSIAANKVRQVRAALCHDELTAELSRKHNDANVLCLPADLVGEQLMRLIVDAWLTTEFEGGDTRGESKRSLKSRAMVKWNDQPRGVIDDHADCC